MRQGDKNGLRFGVLKVKIDLLLSFSIVAICVYKCANEECQVKMDLSFAKGMIPPEDQMDSTRP